MWKSINIKSSANQVLYPNTYYTNKHNEDQIKNSYIIVDITLEDNTVYSLKDKVLGSEIKKFSLENNQIYIHLINGNKISLDFKLEDKLISDTFKGDDGVLIEE